MNQTAHNIKNYQNFQNKDHIILGFLLWLCLLWLGLLWPGLLWSGTLLQSLNLLLFWFGYSSSSSFKIAGISSLSEGLWSRYLICKFTADGTLSSSVRSSGFQKGKNLKICETNKTIAPNKMASIHCWMVSPWYLYILKKTLSHVVMTHWRTKMITTINQ